MQKVVSTSDVPPTVCSQTVMRMKMPRVFWKSQALIWLAGFSQFQELCVQLINLNDKQSSCFFLQAAATTTTDLSFDVFK